MFGSISLRELTDEPMVALDLPRAGRCSPRSLPQPRWDPDLRFSTTHVESLVASGGAYVLQRPSPNATCTGPRVI
jgi:hypothetical protein